jgi:hypothetical protein
MPTTGCWEAKATTFFASTGGSDLLEGGWGNDTLIDDGTTRDCYAGTGMTTSSMRPMVQMWRMTLTEAQTVEGPTFVTGMMPMCSPTIALDGRQSVSRAADRKEGLSPPKQVEIPVLFPGTGGHENTSSATQAASPTRSCARLLGYVLPSRGLPKRLR